MAFDPRTLNRNELIYWLKDFLNVNNRRSLQDLLDQWDIPPEMLEDIEIASSFVKDNSRVQLKSSKTRYFKVYYEEFYEMFYEGKIEALDVGYLILLGKFVDFEDNTLKNEDGSYMSMKEIEEALKVSTATVKRFIKRMIENDIIYKKLDETDKFKRRNKFFINPHILYKGKYIDKKIKDKLAELRREAKEIEKENKKKNKGKSVVISILDRLQEMDYTDMSENEIESLSEELHKLVM